MRKIPFLRPNLIKKEALIPYLAEIDASRIYSNFGQLNSRFEQRVIDEYFHYLGAATTVNNATLGLILAISQSMRPQGKYALMPSFTFAATPLAAIWCGLKPFFIDINIDDWCMDEKLLQNTLQILGDEVAVVIPYATFGTAMNLNFYQQLHESGIPVVVDAAASFGVTEEQNHFGKGFPGAVVFSFHATKSFGIGEGGLVYSANTDFISKVKQGENFGFSANRESTLLGINGKTSEYTAAVALSTLDVYDLKIKKRRQIYDWYIKELKQKDFLNKGWTLQKTSGKIPFQFMPICCPDDQTNTDITQLLASKNIESRTYFSPPCHKHPIFKDYPHTPLLVTDEISNRIISLPLWEEMTEEDVHLIIEGMVST